MTRIDYPGPEYLIVSRGQSALYHAPKNRTVYCIKNSGPSRVVDAEAVGNRCRISILRNNSMPPSDHVHGFWPHFHRQK